MRDPWCQLGRCMGCGMALLVFLLAGCGSDHNGPDGSAASTSQQATLTVETLGARIADMLSTSKLVVGGESYPDWSCAAGAVSVGQQESEAVTTGPLAAGSVATCRPSPVPNEGEHPVVTVLVLDDGGSVSVAESGLAFPLLFPTRPMGVGEEIPSGSNCTDLLAAGSVFSREAENLPPVKRYFAVVLYWFLEGRPSPLMDIDENGVPCETLFSADVVDAVWSGGWLAE